MKIGILTFHWATNYGAVLQCYALQEYLKEQGHDVEVINYKPRKFDFWYKYIRRPWLILNLRKDLITKRKEAQLSEFRTKKLFLSKRFVSTNQMSKITSHYDVVISGSDQVLNSSYTIGGEDYPTAAYYLESFPKSKRIGYAVSFGCTIYPQEALTYAKKWINNFDVIGTRENTGLSILADMDYKGEKTVVPDPTILQGDKLFKDISIEFPNTSNYLCAYILRKHVDITGNSNIIYIDDYNNPLSMEKWLGTIIGSQGLLTNSYHGMIVAILNCVPFVVFADSPNMNDRFNTLLSKLQLIDRIVYNIEDYLDVMSKPIDWNVVKNSMNEFRKNGIDILSFDNK